MKFPSFPLLFLETILSQANGKLLVLAKPVLENIIVTSWVIKMLEL